MLSPNLQSGAGVSPDAIDFTVVPKGFTASIGDLVALDVTLSQATNATEGDRDSLWAVAVAPLDTHVKYGPVAIMLTTTASGQKGRAKLVGKARAYVHKGSGNILKGDILAASASGRYLEASPSVGHRIVARCLENVTSPSSATLADVVFDGIHGTGTYHS